MTPIPEVCITHGTPLILCDQCVAENGMRLKRRLVTSIGALVAALVPRVTHAEKLDLLLAIEGELDRELPG